MFDIAPSELLLVAIVALVVIGPKDLPKVMRVVGYWTGKARGAMRQFPGIDAAPGGETPMLPLADPAPELAAQPRLVGEETDGIDAEGAQPLPAAPPVTPPSPQS